jgi:threonine aldolase
LTHTHKLAYKLSTGILALGGRLLVPTETNMVWLDLSSLNIRAPDMIQRAREMFPENPLTVGGARFVIHHQIEEKAIDDVLALLKTFKEDMVREGLTADKSEASEINEERPQETLSRPFPKLGY